MAEFAQFRLEESIPELELVENLKLLDRSEIRKVIKKRKIYEYRIQRRLKSKDDYLKYINRLARDASQFKLVRSAIGKRIKKLFKQAVFRYPADLKLWNSFMEFCRRMKWAATISSVYASMLKVHNNKEDLWISAAKWQHEENESIDLARQLLLRGLRFLPKSKILYLELFRMELINTYLERATQLDKSRAGLPADETEIKNPVLTGKVAEVVYRNAVKNIDDVGIFHQLIEICKEFDFVESLEDVIYSDMEKSYPENELTRSTIAVRPLKRQSSKGVDVNILEQQCFTNFEEAVKVVPSEKMWCHYIEFCLQRLDSQTYQANKNYTMDHLLNVFSRAADASLLKSELYLKWAELSVCRNSPELRKILRLATERFPNSAGLWTARLANLLNGGKIAKLKIIRLFDKALRSTSGEGSLELWTLALRWNISQNGDMQSVFEHGLKMSSEIAKGAKVFYLEWTALMEGIVAAWNLYQRLWSAPPVCLEFFDKMFDIEAASPQPSILRLRQVMDHACANYGKTHVDLWLRCSQLERKYGKAGEDRSNLVHFRAVQQLAPELADRFVAQHSLQSYDLGNMKKR